MQRRNFPGLDLLGCNHKVSRHSPQKIGNSRFQGCTLGFVEVDLSAVLSHFFSLWGNEDRGEKSKSKEEFKKVVASFLGGHCHPQSPELHSLCLP